MATNQVIPETFQTPESSLPLFDCLTDKQQAFVKAYAKQPWNQANAERTAGYSQGYAADLLAQPRILQAIIEERELIKAQSTASRDVISLAMKLVEDKDASDMARVRALELIADIQGIRKPQAAPAPDSPLTPSSRYAPTPLSLDAAQSALRQLREHNPPESE